MDSYGQVATVMNHPKDSSSWPAVFSAKHGAVQVTSTRGLASQPCTHWNMDSYGSFILNRMVDFMENPNLWMTGGVPPWRVFRQTQVWGRWRSALLAATWFSWMRGLGTEKKWRSFRCLDGVGRLWNVVGFYWGIDWRPWGFEVWSAARLKLAQTAVIMALSSFEKSSQECRARW